MEFVINDMTCIFYVILLLFTIVLWEAVEDLQMFNSIDLCICDPGRRTTLPAQSTDNSHIGIMSILYNNIGKDLSRVSMPVALNEPLSLLQRLSEELEYTDLLDIANHIDDPYERMVTLVYLYPKPAGAQRQLSSVLTSLMYVARFMWQHSPYLAMPGHPGGIATNPSTLFWEKHTRITEKTGASISSASR